ncbi:MAG: protein phosphatase 2C domain-containing protein [Hyphomicrobiaceae bacterium]
MATAEYIGARPQQQDKTAAIALETGALLVLADGLGGHESGAEASRIVVETFREAAGDGRFDNAGTRRQALHDALERANERIGAGVDPAHGQRGMASTAVAAVISDGELSWVSVGDSHLYLWRADELAKLNQDQSQAGIMLKNGNHDPDDPDIRAMKSVLVSALTGREISMVDLPEQPFRVEDGDVLMLASDGLDTLEADEINEIVAAWNAEGSVRLSTTLLETVRNRRVPRQDNTTVAVARVVGEPGPQTETTDAVAPDAGATENPATDPATAQPEAPLDETSPSPQPTELEQSAQATTTLAPALPGEAPETPSRRRRSTILVLILLLVAVLAIAALSPPARQWIMSLSGRVDHAPPARPQHTETAPSPAGSAAPQTILIHPEKAVAPTAPAGDPPANTLPASEPAPDSTNKDEDHPLQQPPQEVPRIKVPPSPAIRDPSPATPPQNN